MCLLHVQTRCNSVCLDQTVCACANSHRFYTDRNKGHTIHAALMSNGGQLHQWGNLADPESATADLACIKYFHTGVDTH